MMETIKKIAMDAVKQAKPLQLYEATVVTAPPNISIRLRADSNLVIPSSILTIASHLKQHRHAVVLEQRTYTALEAGNHTHSISASTNSAGEHTHSLPSTTGTTEEHDHSIGGTTGSNGAHTHSVSASASSSGGHTHTVNSPERTVQTEYQDDTLKVGDHIMVASLQGGQAFFIIDRIAG